MGMKSSTRTQLQSSGFGSIGAHLPQNILSSHANQTISSDGSCSFTGGWVDRLTGANCKGLFCDCCIFHSLTTDQSGGAILFTALDAFTLTRNTFIQCSVGFHGGAFYSNSMNVWMERNCIFQCKANYECPAFFVLQSNGVLNSTLDVFVECSGLTASLTFCGGSWTHGSTTKQLNASHNIFPSKYYVFFVGTERYGSKDGFYQVSQTSISMNAAIEPLCPCTGTFNFDSLNMIGNQGSGNLVRNYQNTILTFTNSVFARNVHTGFGPSAIVEGCSFCSNGFITDIPCNPSKSASAIGGRKCRYIPPTGFHTVRIREIGFIALAWVVLIC